MNAKELKYTSILESTFKDDFLTEAVAKKSFTSLLNLDFALAQNLWEYVCTAYESDLAKNEEVATVYGDIIFNAFYTKGAPKTVKALTDIPALRRAVFTYSPKADRGNAFGIMVDLLVGNKTVPADDIFKCLVKNERINYGPFMKELLERLFIELMKKSATKKLELSRKLGTLLLTYVSKIRTEERAMLEQRIRERL